MVKGEKEELLLYPPCLGKVRRAALEAGKSAVCIIEKLAEVYKDLSELENSTDM